MSESQPESLSGRTFRNRTLRETKFIGCDLGEVVVRGSDVAGMEIDSPWLPEEGGRLLVNGVDVVPLVDAELNRRFPGRESRRAADPDGLRSAWTTVEATWAATLDRAAAMPPGTVDATVDGEWSLAQTLRHLVHATDTWLGKAILEREQPYHPVGLPYDDHDPETREESAVTADVPSFEQVLQARAGRQKMVRDVLADLAPQDLAAPRRNPHAPDHEETVLACLHTILVEEWEHHRFAVRDLDILAARLH